MLDTRKLQNISIFLLICILYKVFFVGLLLNYYLCGG